ncbi:MAG: ATP-binding protein [Bacteroidetes bacterium]|nr:ATP-binding protein [Rhodothermaceae bacterium RA]RMH56569.1 MAG: ATP-binding protein [Bacteroidota bacterium]
MKKVVSDAHRRLHLELPSDVTLLDQVVDETEAFIRPYVDDEAAYRIVLLTTEAVTNAIEHGNQTDPDKMVQVDLRVRDRQIDLRVRDEGPGFDPSKLKNPVAPDHVLDEGGRGIFLMHAMADEVYFEDGGRCVRMVFHRTMPGV